MKPEFLVNDEFDVCGLPFRLILTRDFQFVLENRSCQTTVWGDAMPLDSYREVDPVIGSKVYRCAFKKALNIIFSRRLKTFWFSAGLEPRRLPLYSHLADRIEAKYGYYCCRTGGSFRFYKLQQSAEMA